MGKSSINAPDAPQPVGFYAQAVETIGRERWLHVSGQIPVAAVGKVPKDFGSQCRLAWANVEAQLRAANMSLDVSLRPALRPGQPRRAAGGDGRSTPRALGRHHRDLRWRSRPSGLLDRYFVPNSRSPASPKPGTM
jgi:hypothetical protein